MTNRLQVLKMWGNFEGIQKIFIQSHTNPIMSMTLVLSCQMILHTCTWFSVFYSNIYEYVDIFNCNIGILVKCRHCVWKRNHSPCKAIIQTFVWRNTQCKLATKSHNYRSINYLGRSITSHEHGTNAMFQPNYLIFVKNTNQWLSTRVRFKKKQIKMYKKLRCVSGRLTSTTALSGS